MDVLIFISSFIIINLVLSLNIQRLSKFTNTYDKPDGKLKKHSIKTPLLGGVIFFINFLFFLLFELFFLEVFKDFNRRELFSLLFIVSSFFFLGLYDDKFKMSTFARIVLALTICFITITLNNKLIISSFQISFYENQIFLENLKIIFTIFSFVAFIHACNMLDGINLQLTLFYIFLTIYLFLITSVFTHVYLFIIISLFSILFLNFKKKLFLGDSGAYCIACILAYFIVIEHNVYKNIEFADEIFLIMILPGFELIRLSILRLTRGKNIFEGDLDHLHHILFIKNKYSLITTNLITSTFTIVSLIGIICFKDMYILIFFSLLVYYLTLIFLKR
tara:strand:- start:1460 stop:2461 length:1002 start_codon:yes stop_codon:yes gene_type:complete